MSALAALLNGLRTPGSHLLWRQVAAWCASLGFASLLGYAIGTGQGQYLFLSGALVVFLVVAVGLRENTWLLIPICWMLTGQMEILPLPFSVKEITILLAAVTFLGYLILSRRPLRPPWHALDVCLAFNLAWLGLTVMIHPVGFRVFGAETVGAKPLYQAGVAFIGYFVLVRLPQSARQLHWVPGLVVIGAAVASLLHAITYLQPHLTPYVARFYTLSSWEVYMAAGVQSQELVRYKGLGTVGWAGVMALCSYWPPSHFLVVPWLRWRRLLLHGAFLAAVLCVLLAGFRSLLLMVLAAVAIAAWLWGRWRELLKVGATGAVVFAVLLALQGWVLDLPLSIQRSFSFVPGVRWSEVAARDAEGSTLGRWEWWVAIVRGGLIRNWWVGDGFGVRARDLQRAGPMGDMFEDVVLGGGYHNGPLSTIRYVGLPGLLLFYIFSGVAAYHACRAVRACRQRAPRLLPLAIFLAVHLVWSPVHFTFVFGAYDGALPELVIQVGLLRLLLRFLDEQRLVGAPLPASP